MPLGMELGYERNIALLRKLGVPRNSERWRRLTDTSRWYWRKTSRERFFLAAGGLIANGIIVLLAGAGYLFVSERKLPEELATVVRIRPESDAARKYIFLGDSVTVSDGVRVPTLASLMKRDQVRTKPLFLALSSERHKTRVIIVPAKMSLTEFGLEFAPRAISVAHARGLRWKVLGALGDMIAARIGFVATKMVIPPLLGGTGLMIIETAIGWESGIEVLLLWIIAINLLLIQTNIMPLPGLDGFYMAESREKQVADYAPISRAWRSENAVAIRFFPRRILAPTMFEKLVIRPLQMRMTCIVLVSAMALDCLYVLEALKWVSLK